METESLVFVGSSDLAGLVRGKSFPVGESAGRMARGITVTPSHLMMSPFGTILETPFGTAGEVLLVPEMSAMVEIPVPDAPSIQLALGDFRTLAGEPWEYCPRDLLRRGLDALRAETGLQLLATFEQEMVYTGVEDRPGAPYALDTLRRQGPFGGMLLAAMRAAGIDPDSFLAEYGPRQFEVTAGPAVGIRAADEAVMVRELARAVAAVLGQRAIMAPMPHPEGVGNGSHIHWSLLDAAWEPMTHDAGRTFGLSEVAEHFTAGLLYHLPDLVAVTAPCPASYYRLRPGRWAPTVTDLGFEDRGSAIRICPVTATGSLSIARQFNVEFRVADATASPYLALGALVHAGLDGIRNKRTLADATPAPLPASLPEALDRLEGCAAAAGWFGEPFLELYLRFKRAELKALAGLDEAAICARYAEIY
jgi:glutamine synthetase